MAMKLAQSISVKLVSNKVAASFFNCDLLFESCRIDGIAKEDFIKTMSVGYSHVGTYYYGNLVAVTAFKVIGTGDTLEVHTFVLPKYREIGREILRGHMAFFKMLNVEYLVTMTSQFNLSVRNFLKKRLGFKEVLVKEAPVTKDGETVITTYLRRDLNEPIF